MNPQGVVALAERYGPWALVVGASEGIGAEFARVVARHGLNVALVARRRHAHDEVAAAIGAECGVEVRTVVVDLTAPSAIFVSSGAGLVGGRNMVAYAATKAFDMVLAEALWAELHDRGVDVLGLVLGVTDTPALRRRLLRRGQLADPEAPVPGAATAEEVVACALANLTEGPTCFATEDVREGAKHLGAMSRNDAARMLLTIQGEVMGSDEEAVT